MKQGRRRESIPVHLSLPVRGRGLKHDAQRHVQLRIPVAPRAGARIETGLLVGYVELRMSLPVRGRGLKRLVVEDRGKVEMSLPVRGRGLKRLTLSS